MINKIIEVMSRSDKSWEDAAHQAIAEVTKTVNNVRSIYVQDFSAKVQDNKITEYRVTAKVTFEVRG